MQNETLESVTQAISYEGYDMTAKVSNGKIAAGIIGIVVILAFVVATIIFIRKKQKGNGFGILGGVITYISFNYFAPSLLINLIFVYSPFKKYADSVNKVIVSTAAFIIVYTLSTAFLAVLGRMLANKVFAYRLKSFGEGFSFGQGIAYTQAAFTMSSLFQLVSPMIIINRSGLETLVSGAKDQEAATKMLDSAMELIGYKTSAIVMLTIVAVLFVIYQLAITIPMYAAYQKKIHKGYYGMVLGSYIVIEAIQYMAERKVINVIVQLIATAVVVAAITYVCIRIYNKCYKDEERDLDKEKEDRIKKMTAAKKIPRFENLSNL